MRVERELMRGAGPAAVLKLLEPGAKYGYELIEALADRSAGVLAMGQSTLYPLLYNLEAQGLVRAEWRLADDGRQWQALVQALAGLGILNQPSPVSLKGAPA